MNQINIDSLLQIGNGTKIEQSLKLDSSQLYQALLQIGRDQDARLKIQTGQGPLQVAIPPQTAQQILQTAQQLMAATTTATPQSPAMQAENSAPAHTSIVQHSDTKADSNNQRNSPASANTQEVKVFVQIQPLGAEQIQLTLRLAGKPLTLPLQASQLLQLLQTPAPGPQQRFSVQAQQQGAKPEALNLQWPVQLSRQGSQLQILLSQGQAMRIDLAALPEAKHWPQQQAQPAQLQMSTEQGQLRIRLVIEGPRRPVDTKSAAATGDSNHALQAKTPEPKTQQPEPKASLTERSPVISLLKPAQVQQLLPQLAKASWPDQLGSEMKQWLAQAKIQTTSSAVPSWQWQLKQPSPQQIQLELTPQAETRQLRVAVSELNRPFQFLAVQPSAQASQTLQTDSRDLWRQWLPLSQSSPDLLADSPALPVAARQVLQELRALHPDTAKLQNQQLLMQQINAALQFNPMQSPAQPASIAGGLAIAIQLLLGRLGAQLPVERQMPAQKEKLQQIIGQLDRSQSAQLLRQLSGHSSQLQSAQIANLEQQSTPAQQQKPEQMLIQLPLLQNGESRFAELAVSEREAEGAEQHRGQRCWQLTMKFDLAEQGELLVQVRLIGKEVSLQFYADNAKTVHDTSQFLPLFKDRLTMQGLQVAEAGCQLGKIPEHLYQRGTSLLQVRV